MWSTKENVSTQSGINTAQKGLDPETWKAALFQRRLPTQDYLGTIHTYGKD